MTKSIKELFEVYRPKAKDEADFVDKHVTIKHKDRNGNGDDVFKGNTKYVKRKEERHGYDAPEDEKVYEETEELDELSRDTLKTFAKKRASQSIQHKLKGDEESSSKAIKSAMKAEKKMKNEEVDQIKDLIMNSLINAAEELGEEFDLETLEAIAEETLSELSVSTLKSYRTKAREDAYDADAVDDERRFRKRAAGSNLSGKKIVKKGGSLKTEEVEDLDEVTITTKSAADAYAERTGQVKKKTSVPKDPKTGKTLYQKVTSEETELEEGMQMWKVDFPKQHAGKAIDAGTAHVKAQNVSHAHRVMAKRLGVDHKLLKAKVSKSSILPEEAEQIDELSKNTLRKYERATQYGGTHKNVKGNQIARAKLHGTSDGYRARVPANEEVEQIDELSPATLGSYIKKAKTQMSRSDTVAGRLAGERMKGGKPSAQEKKHSDRANKRYFGIDKAVDRLTKEEVEQIDELSPGTLGNYVKRSQGKLLAHGMELQRGTDKVQDTKDAERKINNRFTGVTRATNKLVKKALTKEDIINIDEISKPALGRYINKAKDHIDTTAWRQGYREAGTGSPSDRFERKLSKRHKGIETAVKKLTKEDIINKAIERYIPEDIKLPSMEDRLLDKLEQYNLSESHIHTLLSVFESLNEQNQHRMLENVDTVEGVNSLLDFAISHRGE